MTMKFCRFIFLLILTFGILKTDPAQAIPNFPVIDESSTDSLNFESLKSLEKLLIGNRIELKLVNGDKIKGKVLELEQNKISLLKDSKIVNDVGGVYKKLDAEFVQVKLDEIKSCKIKNKSTSKSLVEFTCKSIFTLLSFYVAFGLIYLIGGER